ncbi:MAG: type II toxin-antitoxin system PemK/MazF family toxin [Deltaproteobacteria bacterium]|nr:type II toxin-antitoxin system PemK/MazF family toxin [Deltaproteobacteria bacterium]
MQRGEIWWAHFPRPVGKRPVVLLSRDKAIQVRTHLTVVQITRTIRSIPTEVLLGPEEGLPKKCVANLDVIQTIPKSILLDKVCLLSSEKMEEIESAACFALGFKLI